MTDTQQEAIREVARKYEKYGISFGDILQILIVSKDSAAYSAANSGINVNITNNWDGVVISSELDMAEVMSSMSDKAVVAMSERLEQLRIFDARAYGGVVMP